MLGPAGLGIPVPWVVGEILGHRRIGVQLDLAKAKAVSLLLSQHQQPRPDTAALGGGQHRDVLQQQIARLRVENDKAHNLSVVCSNPCVTASHSLGVVSRHGGRSPANPGHIAFIGRRRDPAKHRYVLLSGGADDDHRPNVRQSPLPLGGHAPDPASRQEIRYPGVPEVRPGAELMELLSEIWPMGWQAGP